MISVNHTIVVSGLWSRQPALNSNGARRERALPFTLAYIDQKVDGDPQGCREQVEFDSRKATLLPFEGTVLGGAG